MSRSIIPRLGPGAQRQIRQQLGDHSKNKKQIAEIAQRFAPALKSLAEGPPPERRVPIEFTMPIPPSVNHLFATAKSKRVKATAYRSWWDVTLQELVFVQKVPHLSGKVALSFWIRRFSDLSDLSNRIKSAEDVICAARIIDDDRFVTELHAYWSTTVDTCRVRIEPR